MKAKTASILAVCVLSWLALMSPAHATSGTGEVFLSTDAAYSEATYVIQFVTDARHNIDKIQVTLPPGTNASNAWLGRFLVGRPDDESDGEDIVAEQLRVVLPDTLIIELKGHPHVKKGTTVLLELFHLTNPQPGNNHTIQVTTLDRRGHAVEVIQPIAYGTYTNGGSTKVQAGTGLLKSVNGDYVTLSADTSVLQQRVTGSCPVGSSIRVIDATGTVVCQTDNVGTGDITAVNTPPGSGLLGGVLSGDATLSVDPTVFQKRVTTTCPEGSSIRAIDGAGNVVCQTDNVGPGDITAVNTAPGSGLLGGQLSGDVNLTVDTMVIQKRVVGSCPVGSSIRMIDGAGNVVCQTDNVGGGVTGVNTLPGSGVTAVTGPNGDVTLSIAPGSITSTLIADGTVGAIDVNPAEIQLRVTGTCSVGAINQINPDGTVLCNDPTAAAGVTAVTASAPLFSTGGATPNISIRGVIVSGTNAAIGTSALGRNTGVNNTSSGVQALARNTTGSSNTAAGANALFSNDLGSNNTANGSQALAFNTGSNNTASGASALFNNGTGSGNTAAGANALDNNTSGSNNTAIGAGSDVALGNLTNATVIGAGAVVDASNKIRIGNDQVTVIEFPTGASVSSDRNRKEHFQPVDGEEVLRKLRNIAITSWNYIGQDPKQFRHYGPMAQDFYAAFGQDGMGTVGTATTITSTDMDGILMIAVRALEQRTAELKEKEAQIKALESRLEVLERVIGTTPAGLR